MIKTYSNAEVQQLLDAYNVSELLEMSDLTELDVVRYLLNEGIMEYPEWLELETF